MTKPESPGDRPDPSPLNRRDLLRLGAASLGAPLLFPSTTAPAAPDAVPQLDGKAAPLSEFPLWEGEDYPDHPDARARNVNNLKFIGLAMHNFAAVSGGRLPTAAICKGGKRLLSWRVAILPYLEQFALYQRFHLDEAWDSPHNASLVKEMPRVYAPVTHTNAPPYATYYQGLSGPGAVFDGEEGPKITDVIYVARPTLLVVEAADSVTWTKPADVPYETAAPLPKLGGQFDDGFYATFCDGSVRFIGREVAPERIHAAASRWRATG
jgi:Protein of unknown function (DUF1559)